MGRHEKMIIDELLAAYREKRPVPYWGFLGQVARIYRTPDEILRDQFVQIMALCNRLIKDKKIVRDRRQGQNNIRLTDHFFNILNKYG